MNQIVKHEPSALALPEAEMLQVLGSSLYPGASPASIKMVLGYCRAAGLDPMQKPVHIVPMWDSKAGQMRDVIMPGINSYRTSAARSGAFAGMSEPEFGEDVDGEIGGVRITYPRWCRVTAMRRLPTGEIASFTAIEYWLENYAPKGGKEKSVAPNAMWMKRTRGQLAKCAQAQALRIAFPELASPLTAEEMEGKSLDAAGEIIEQPQPCPPELLKQAQEAADKGREAFAAFWKTGTNGETRNQIGPHLADLKARTDAADKALAEAAAKPTEEAAEPDAAPAADDEFVAAMEAAESREALVEEAAPHERGARGAKR
ncbi:MAG: phage recombination protein Bet [Planctomycetota bacterium]